VEPLVPTVNDSLADQGSDQRRALAQTALSLGRRDEAERLLADLMVTAEQPRDGHLRVENLFRLDRRDDAENMARAAACLWPDDAETWHRLGIVAGANGHSPAAIAAYQRAITVQPDHDEAASNLAVAYKRNGNPAQAVRLYRDIIGRCGDQRPEVHVNLAGALGALGKTREACARFDWAETLRADPVTGDNALYYRSYLDDQDNRTLFAAHQGWARRYAAGLAAAAAPHANAPDPGRRLRIGYVSPDFCAHSCSFFLLPLYQHHDPSQVEVFSYANLEREDGLTAQFRRAGHAWRDISRLSDDEAAALIRRDGIDILVDLAGHTARNRLLLFARKPAPVQLTWLGYPTTTGLEAIDWRLSDPWLTPPDTTEGFAEGLWRLDRISHCYRPPDDAPAVGPLPVERNGIITFGSANNFAKVSDACLRLWAMALNAVPGSRLRLKSRNLENAEARDALFGRFAAADGDPARLDLASGNEKTNDHLDQYNQVDIALDTTPYGGMTTTCEALWMGVPVITLAGDRTAARYATAVLAAAGLGELVARTPGHFATIAARLAADRPALAALRAGLRQRLDASPLCDEAGFARAMEQAYRAMWSRWCAGQAGSTGRAAQLENAKALLRRQNPAGAIRQCQDILAAAPGVGEALRLFGSAMCLAGDAVGATQMLQLAQALQPGDPATMLALARAHQQAGRLDEAFRLAEQAAALAPDLPEAPAELASLHAAAGRPDQAAPLYEAAVRGGIDRPAVGYAWIETLQQLKRRDQALHAAHLVACRWPDQAESWYWLGISAFWLGMIARAQTTYLRALAIMPNHHRAALNLAVLYRRHGNPARSIELCRAVIAQDDSTVVAGAQLNLGIALAAVGKAGEAVAAFDIAEALEPDPATGSNAAYFRSYLDEVDNRGLFAAHQAWNRRYAAGLAAAAPHANAAEPGRRLRIGYVSPDFVGHSCAFFLLPLYQHHDPRQVEVFSYANLEREDGVTEQFRRAGHAWRDISRLSDDEAAALVRRDGIDILVDLAGHTARNRLLLFARKPAPIQLTWLGYPTTTGLEAIDWRISDRWLTPADTTEGFAEGLWRLERVSHCYRPPETSPPVGPLPAERNGVITFGSANNFAKISDACLRLWAGALAAAPNSRLRLKSRYLDSDEARDTLSARFAAAGGDPARLDLASGNFLVADHLDQYNQVDIALDTTPYGGMTTTCEALWMGVPVITLAGDRTAARYATAVLAALGLEELVARTPGDFAAIAARLAADRPALAARRAGLRQRLDASPLRDEAGFARAMEDAYRAMWGRWCATKTT
jgi:predicted O-linked N-acetylglucosamine transferase (SPINDLY family)/predicted Zn-dependent protease